MVELVHNKRATEVLGTPSMALSKRPNMEADMPENYPTKSSITLSKHDLTGQRFGRLTVLGFAGMEKHGKRWECRCDCGATTTTRGYSLTSGHTKSCGCLQLDAVAASGEMVTRHGHARKGRVTGEYRIWQHIKKRCYDPKDKRFAAYGGRGIAMCDAWRGSFDRFFADVGFRTSEKHSLDRVDNNKGYEPGNVRWATAKEQCRNTRRNVWLTFQGETLTVAEWAERLGIKGATILYRIRAGWSVEGALTRPADGKFRLRNAQHRNAN